MEVNKERLVAWGHESVRHIRTGKWWLVIVPIVSWFLGGLLEHRLFHTANTFIDEHTPAFFARIKPFLSVRSLGIAGIVLAAMLLVVIVRAYFDSKPGIVGTADLMLQELDISDLEITQGGASYQVNLAAFARIEVGSLDKPRTIRHFEIEMIAPDGAKYEAKSEYEVGRYDYLHDVEHKDSWGFVTSERKREPMEDLAAKVRMPIQPLTHVPRAWVRWEIPSVKQGHEPRNCQIKIWAVDPGNRRHEITTDDMQVKAVDDDREYAVARER